MERGGERWQPSEAADRGLEPPGLGALTPAWELPSPAQDFFGVDVTNPIRTDLSILLPALNEEGGVREVMNRIPRQSLRRLGIAPMIYLLDGHSTDGTCAVARQLGAEVVLQTGNGKGSAFREFIPKIKEEFTVILDCDGTYPPEVIPRLVKKLGEGHSVVVGSRLKGEIDEGAMSRMNYLGNRMLSWLASTLFNAPISDVCSGMWAFSSTHLKSLELTADGFDLEADIFAECARKGIRIAEVPIPYHKRIGRSKLRVRTGLQIAMALLRKRFGNGLFGRAAERASEN